MKVLMFFLVFVSYLFSSQDDSSYIEGLIKSQRYEEAIRILSSKKSKIEEDPKIGYYLGICYFKIGNYTLAEEYFEKSYYCGYSSSSLFYNLGVTKFKLKKYKEAIGFLEKTHTDRFIYDQSLYLMIVSYLKLKDKKAAIEKYKVLQKNYPYSINLLKAQDVLEKFGIDYRKYVAKNVVIYLQGSYGYETNINYVPEMYYELLGLSDSSYSTYVSVLFFDETVSVSLSSVLKNYLKYNNYNFKNFFGSLKFELIPKFNIDLVLSGGYYIEDRPLLRNLASKIKTKMYLDDLILEISAGCNTDEYLDTNYKLLNGVTTEYILSFKIGLLKADAGYKIKNTQSDLYSYTSLFLNSRIEKRFKKVSISIGANIIDKSFKVDRKDKINSFYSSLRIKLTNQFEVSFNYTNSTSDSSNALYSYKTQNYSFGIGLYF